MQLAVEVLQHMLGRFRLEWHPETKNPTRRANAQNGTRACYSSSGPDLSATSEYTDREQKKRTCNTCGSFSSAAILWRIYGVAGGAYGDQLHLQRLRQLV